MLSRQQAEILHLLKQEGAKGVNSYIWRTSWIQLPVRIKELKEMGYNIVSERQENRSVNYVLQQLPTASRVGEQEAFL